MSEQSLQIMLLDTHPGTVAVWLAGTPSTALFAMSACCATGPPLQTMGALDLGGSSLEVTFLPPPGAAIANDADKGASRHPVFPAPMRDIFHGGLHSLVMSAAISSGCPA